MVFLTAPYSLFSQPYNTAIGVRFGPLYGITMKKSLNEKHSLEGILSFPWKGFVINGLYEYNFDIPNADNFRWYAGFGGHVGVFNSVSSKNNYSNSSGVVLGVDGIIGIEHTMANYPLNFSLDFKPVINIINSNSTNINEWALSARYAF